MDHPGRFGRGVALVDHPGAGLLGSGGQIRLQLQGVEAGTGQRIQSALMLSDRLQQFGSGGVVEFLQLGLDLGVKEHRVRRGDHVAQFSDLGIVGQHRFVAVEHVQKGLRSQQVQLGQQRRVDLRARGEQCGALIEHRLRGQCRLVDHLPILAVAGFLLQPRECLFEGLQVGQNQLGVDYLDVRSRVDLAVDVHHVVVGKHPDHLADGVTLADVGQELVAQAGALGCALDDAGDVDERHRRRQDPLRAEHLGQRGQSRIGQWDNTLVGFDGGERIVGRQNVVTGQRVEQG